MTEIEPKQYSKQTEMHICLFDIDGTLLNTGGAGQDAMLAALAEVFGITRPVENIPMAGRTDRAITHDLFRFFDLEHHPENWDRFVATYLRLLPQYLKIRSGLVLPGIYPLIEILSARNDVQLGLLTGNFREGARLKLSHYNLFHHFGFGGYGDHHHDRDDVAREALGVAQQTHADNVNLAKVWVIGDTPADIRCGRAIGANAVAVATGHFSTDELHSHNPHHVFSDFSNPQCFVELLN
ncbi:MAG: HAD family hydrolase [Planctomycetaceae bacterium]